MYNFFRFLVHLFSFVINTPHLSATQIAIQIATQSSTYGVDYAASRAIDGNVSTISHTADNVLQPHWLELDLGKEYAITNVTVVNRWKDCCDRINGVVVHLLNGATETAQSAPLVYKEPCPGVTAADQTYEFEFNGVTATKVKLVKDAKNGSSLNIAEVYVYGHIRLYIKGKIFPRKSYV